MNTPKAFVMDQGTIDVGKDERGTFSEGKCPRRSTSAKEITCE